MKPIPEPGDPIAAATHPDPYSYYAALVRDRPLYFDTALNMWIAASAEAVGAVLGNAQCRVRPPAEPVPTALLDSSAAEIFRHLVRITDGAGHCPLKQAVHCTLASLDMPDLRRHSATWATQLCPHIDPAADAGRLNTYACQLPVHVLASQLGFSPAALPAIVASIDDFVLGIAPAASAGQIERGKRAATALIDAFDAKLQQAPGAGLLHELARQAASFGVDNVATVIANGIGFITQSYEATAGLIGNTLLRLTQDAGLRAQLRTGAMLLAPVLEEVLRFDPPVQNTRRFVASDTVVAGQVMRAGDAILVLLAAANRDPRVNPEPQRFDPLRRDRISFSFGFGAHACPGDRIAVAIAAAGIGALLDSDLLSEQNSGALADVRYRRSVNVRIPEWRQSR